MWRDLRTCVRSSSVHRSQEVRQLECPPACEQVKKLPNVPTRAECSAPNKEGSPPTWMNLEDVTGVKKSQLPKAKYCVIPLT